MKRILLTISYDGTDYHGWQVQPNGITVQETMQNGLQKILGTRPMITGCSRTDAGVHAEQFCFHFECDDCFPENAFLKGLNSLLPDDISVVDCKEVPNDFHARYNAKGKTYVYGMYTGIKSPFLSRYYLHLDKKPDIALMNEFCKTVIGEHDFAGFSSSGRTVEDTVRTITECSVSEENGKILFSVTADGFLYNMVRILAGTALAVGYGRLNVLCANEIFETNNRSLGGDTLPPCGLILKKVYY